MVWPKDELHHSVIRATDVPASISETTLRDQVRSAPVDHKAPGIPGFSDCSAPYAKDKTRKAQANDHTRVKLFEQQR
jgi:hypothetical protein